MLTKYFAASLRSVILSNLKVLKLLLQFMYFKTFSRKKSKPKVFESQHNTYTGGKVGQMSE